MATEADVDVNIVVPFLKSIGVGADQIRAQRTFSLRLGRNMVHQVGDASRSTAGGRLDYVVLDSDGMPLFVVELKAAGETLSDDDRDQGVSYARLLHPIAPFVLVSNGTTSCLYDSITKERINDAHESEFFKNGRRLSADADLCIRSEALRHFLGYSTDNIRAFAAAQREARMEAIRGNASDLTKKYIPDVYVPRRGVREAVDEFLASDRVVFALVGDSGVGKTNEMCALADEYGQTHVVLFFNGTELYGSFARTIADEFNWHFSEHATLPDLCRRISYLGQRLETPTLIIIDAVDEADIPSAAYELGDLSAHLSAFGGAIKLIVSAKSDQWKHFCYFRGIPSPLISHLFTEPGKDSGSDLEAQPFEPINNDYGSTHEKGPPASARLAPFDSEDTREAIARYSRVFAIAGEWQWDVVVAAADPFMLRIIAEAARHRNVVPSAADEFELLRGYMRAKLDRMPDSRAAERELSIVARTLVESTQNLLPWNRGIGRNSDASGERVASVREDEVRATANISAAATFGDVLVEHGLLARFRDDNDGVHLAFAYDRVRNYVIATDVYRFRDAADASAFCKVVLRALSHPIGSLALQWYIPRTTPAQWQGFVDAASVQAERVVRTYEVPVSVKVVVA